MKKEQLIEAIRNFNRSVQHEFLSGFPECELESYLRRLQQLLDHRGPGSVWVREGDTHAVVTSQH
jgi:hypothetical protein